MADKKSEELRNWKTSFKYYLVRVGPRNKVADELHGDLGIVRAIIGSPLTILYLKSLSQHNPGGLELRNLGYITSEEVARLSDTCGYPEFRVM